MMQSLIITVVSIGLILSTEILCHCTTPRRKNVRGLRQRIRV